MSQNSILKKTFVLIIIGFFVIINFQSSNGLIIKKTNVEYLAELKEILSSGDIIIVDDIPGWGPDNPPEDYTKIQDAIDESNTKDIIYVFEGLYNEKLVIEKSIFVIGQNTENTKINCNDTGEVVNISADNVVLCGFTIINTYKFISADNLAKVIKINSDNVTISNNIINSKVGTSIYLENANFNYINSNKIFENNIAFLSKNSNNNIIEKNDIKNNDIAIDLYSSKNNTFKRNEISKNKLGLSAKNSNNNNISKNIISHNTHGLFLEDSNRNLISQNNFYENKKQDARFIGHCKNYWEGNYWNRFRILPKPIFGRMGIIFNLILWVNFDLKPARYPNEI